MGDGTQTRDFLYIDDLIQALLKSIVNKPDAIINLGSGNQISLVGLVREIEHTLGSEIPIRYLPAETGKSRSITYSINRAQKVIDWTAETPLRDGIIKTWSEL